MKPCFLTSYSVSELREKILSGGAGFWLNMGFEIWRHSWGHHVARCSNYKYKVKSETIFES